MAVNPGVHVDIEFALPHAINLAEAGQLIQDKRTGTRLTSSLWNKARRQVQGICTALKSCPQSTSCN